MDKTKTISIEAAVLSEEKSTGVGRAVKGYITSLVGSDIVNSYHIFLISPNPDLLLDNSSTVIHYFSNLLPAFLRKKKYFNILYKIKFIYIWLIIPILIKKIKTDVFIGTHGLLFPLFISKGIKTFYIVYDFVYILYPETMSKKNQFLVKYLARRNIRKADEIITISESVASELKHYIDKNKTCHPVHLGFDQSIFYPLKKDSPEVKSTLEKFNITKPYILSVATIEPRKNLEMVCRAFEQFNTENKYQLVLAGKIGWQTSSILDLINNSSVAGDIIITGFVDDSDLSPLFSGAELFIFIALYEGFGLPVLEAMACGCPVLISDIPPLKEISNDTAIEVEPKNLGEIVSTLKSIMKDKKLKNDLKKKSLERSKQFTWSRAGDLLKRIIIQD